MRLEARLSYALIGLVQATGSAGGLDSGGNINEGALTNTKMSHARLTKAQGGATMRLTNIS